MKPRAGDRGMGDTYDKIDVLLSSGRYEEVVRRCDESLRDDPGDAKAQDRRDKALRDVAQATEKLRRSEESLRDDPEDFSSAIDRGMALMQLGRVDEALAHMDAMLKDDPDDCDVMYVKVIGLALNGRLREARKCNKLLRRTCPGHLCSTPPSSLMRLGEAANMIERGEI